MPEDRDDGRGELLAAAVEQLYEAAPEAFTGRRAELAAAAREAGDRAAAKAIGALRRPTRAAWVVNRLARADPSAPRKLAELAGALRAAQQAGHGPRLRELSAARGALVDALTAQALTTAGLPDPPPSLCLAVGETLAAALADPGVAADFAAGRLTRAAQWSGFGVLPAEAGPGPLSDEAAAGSLTGGAGAGGDQDPGAPAGAPAAPGRHPAGTAGTAGTARGDAEAMARARAREEDRLAHEAAERAARRRRQHEEAERAAAAAASAATEAGAAEDRLEAEVRDLEQRLTRARADLATARLRARRTEAAERRARQALERPRQGG